MCIQRRLIPPPPLGTLAGFRLSGNATAHREESSRYNDNGWERSSRKGSLTTVAVRQARGRYPITSTERRAVFILARTARRKKSMFGLQRLSPAPRSPRRKLRLFPILP